MFKDKFTRDVFKALVAISAILVLCKYTAGAVAVAVALAGAYFALQRMSGYLAICYVMFPLFMSFNRVIVGLNPLFLMTARLGNLFMIAAMILTGAGLQGQARERLPIMWMFAYCLVACISSIDGWMPLISYLKLAQFTLFLIGLLFVARIIQRSDQGLYQLRCAMMAIAIIFLIGSVLAYFIPSVGYSMMVAQAESWGWNLTGTDIASSEGLVMFNGMLSHSQMLAPVVAMMAAWVMCDMILVEKRFTWLHGGTLVTAPVLLYMSRSRGGLLDIVAVMVTVMFVCVPRARLAQAVRSRFALLMIGAASLLVVVAVIAQVRNQAISRWLRKVEDVRGDNRTLGEAFTDSRTFSIEYNLNDFRLNPMFGKGFQVMRGMDRAYRARQLSLFSAPVEKGVTPYVILGETGLMGAGVFVIFLISFYTTCLKRRYLALFTLFTCYLVINLADSTLFSPSGGGVFWIVSCLGGFGIDMISIRQAQGVWTGPGAGNLLANVGWGRYG